MMELCPYGDLEQKIKRHQHRKQYIDERYGGREEREGGREGGFPELSIVMKLCPYGDLEQKIK